MDMGEHVSPLLVGFMLHPYLIQPRRMKNDWLAKRPMGHPPAISQLVNRLQKQPKSLNILKKHEKTFKSKCPVQEAKFLVAARRNRLLS